MKYIYLTARCVQNSRYTSVEVMDKAFETKKMADAYKEKHNREHPNDLLHVMKKELFGKLEDFEYLKTTIVLEDGVLQSITSARKNTTNLDTTKEQLAYITYQESSRAPIGSVRVLEETSLKKQLTFRKVMPTEKNKKKRVQQFVLKQRIGNQSITSIEQFFMEKVNELQGWIEQYQAHPLHLFASSQEIEAWINTKKPLEELEKQVNKYEENIAKQLKKYNKE